MSCVDIVENESTTVDASRTVEPAKCGQADNDPSSSPLNMSAEDAARVLHDEHADEFGPQWDALTRMMADESFRLDVESVAAASLAK